MTPPARLPFTLACGLLAAGLALAAAAQVPAPAAAPVPAPAQAAPPAAAAAPAVQGTPAAGAQANKPSVSSRAPIRTAQVRTAPATRPEASPTWAELTPQQQQSLAPLTGTWRALSEAHKRKWLAVSENYPTMPPGEQARLHSRMAEWAALSPQQRNVARLNFAETQKVNPDDKRAKWEAYQNLSPEEKRKLAAAAAKPSPPPTAVAVQPVPQQKLARIPKPKKQPETATIAVVPGKVEAGTTAPQVPPQAQPTLPPLQP